jgi:hypothetical protein
MMSNFWESEIGEISGTVDEAFSKTYSQIPDSTTAISRIEGFENKEYMGTQYLQIQWVLTEGEFAGRHVFQKLHVFDHDAKKRHRFLNLLKLIYGLFNIKPLDAEPPSDQFLMRFKDKVAGIKIQLTEPNKDTGKQYNWVSEVAPAKGFECVTGYSPAPQRKVPEGSAFSRNPKGNEYLDDDSDIPF